MNIKIDNEFSSFIPAMQPEEFENLKSSILLEGCRESLVVWEEEDLLIDGHNRYRICGEAEIPFKVHKMSFDGRDDVLMWIYNNQISRRNLQPIDKVKMVEKMKPIFERRAKERQGAGSNFAHVKEIIPEHDKGQTRDQLGAQIGVSGKTFSALAKINEHGDVTIIDAVRKKIIGVTEAASILNVSREEQIEIINKKKAKKNKQPKKRRTKKEIEEQKDIDKRYSAESRQLFDLALHQMKRIRNEDVYGIVVLNEMKNWCNNKIKTIERSTKNERGIP